MNARHVPFRFFVFFLPLAFVLSLLPPVFAAGPGDATKQFRIAYIETGPYWNYTSLFNGIQEGLRAEGWGDRASFPPELVLSLGWGEENRKLYREKVRALLSREDIDLVLSMGTEATLAALAENPRRLPIVASSISNPVDAGIVASPTDSGVDNLTTFLNPMGGRVMFTTFYSLIRFKKLGIMYNNSATGKTYSFTNDAVDTGRDLGFEVLEYGELSVEETVEDCLKGVRELHRRGADAIFLSDLNCLDLSVVNPSPIYDYLDAYRIPTFSSTDREQVRNFAMMGLLLFDNKAVGLFQAGQIISILKGAKPRDLSMSAPHNYRMLINLEVAERNGIDLPMDVLIMSDELFLRQERRWQGAPH